MRSNSVAQGSFLMRVHEKGAVLKGRPSFFAQHTRRLSNGVIVSLGSW